MSGHLYKPAQMKHKQRTLFWVNLEHVGEHILKTEAAQTKLLPAQTSTNKAQTIDTILATFCVVCVCVCVCVGGGGGNFTGL